MHDLPGLALLWYHQIESTSTHYHNNCCKIPSCSGTPCCPCYHSWMSQQPAPLLLLKPKLLLSPLIPTCLDFMTNGDNLPALLPLPPLPMHRDYSAGEHVFVLLSCFYLLWFEIYSLSDDFNGRDVTPHLSSVTITTTCTTTTVDDKLPQSPLSGKTSIISRTQFTLGGACTVTRLIAQSMQLVLLLILLKNQDGIAIYPAILPAADFTH